MRVSVCLRAPWPPGSAVTLRTGRGRGRLMKRPTVSVLTSELLGVDAGVGESEGQDLMSFSLEEPPPLPRLVLSTHTHTHTHYMHG